MSYVSPNGMSVNFHYCALYYLNWWYNYDEKYCLALQSGNESEKISQLQDAAKQYKVIRNIEKRQDVHAETPLERMATVLRVLEEPEYASIKEDELVDAIIRAERAIRNTQTKGVLSLTTKMFWLKHKDPIIIYDTNAIKALKKEKYKVAQNDYLAYVTKWKDCYKKHRREIAEACSELPKVWKYAEKAYRLSEASVKTVASEEWFRRRTFDIYLWHEGA